MSFCSLKTCFFYPCYHPKKVEHILKNVLKPGMSVCLSERDYVINLYKNEIEK